MGEGPGVAGEEAGGGQGRGLEEGLEDRHC